MAHLEGTEHCGEDVQLHRLLPDALGLLDALCKVVQHLKPALHREDTCVKPSLSTLLIVHIVVNTLGSGSSKISRPQKMTRQASILPSLKIDRDQGNAIQNAAYKW